MRRRRFNRIKEVIRKGEAAAKSLPYIQKYLEVVDGTRKITRGAASIPDLQGRQYFTLKPFGLPATANDTVVWMTGRANTERNTFGLTNDVLNLDPDGAGRSDAGLLPAKAVVSRWSTSSDKISDITGLTYKKRNASTYTCPFGKTGTENEFDVQEEIFQAVRGSGDNRGVTFKPERMYAS
ncbi:MAG: hypothetical protein MH825_08295 [Cyanobacteria bacterium]|nr:hypothetical protein [Cyanobacteriota bacterium]